jgi:hypothetical protein
MLRDNSKNGPNGRLIETSRMQMSTKMAMISGM